MNNLIKNFLDRPILSRTEDGPWMRSMLEPLSHVGDIEDRSGFWARLEVRDTKDAFLCLVDVPGVKEEDLSISVSGNHVTIAGKRMTEHVDKADTFTTTERGYGSFKRTLSLPDVVDVGKVRATLESGVLTLLMPKKAEHTVRDVPIKVVERKKLS